ncbi:inositol monophosphatase family protein [Primorskyibacter sp. S187A]|uniref:inositol monophosphatase family protein n=1 Tax=Primorskyibacter sp. S187A TaxID=3415130 RepID=UPI003C7E1A18
MTDQLPMPIPSPLTKAQKSQLLNLVRRAARAEILPRFRKIDMLDIETKSGALDLVTAADKAAEAMITRGLQMSFPSALIVGEEAAEGNPKLRDGIAEAEMCFLIDPVDGTWNFAKGLATFGTMVAVCRFGKPVLGLIYDPLGDDVIWADEDHAAAFLPASGAPRKVSTAAPKAFGDLLGYIHLKHMDKEAQPKVAALYPELAMAGSLRCSAHEYRLLAQGHVDFVLSSQQTPWDHAAGVVLCQQAGGHAAMLDGSDYSAAVREGYLLSASCKDVWESVAQKLIEIDLVPQSQDATTEA